MIHLHACIFGKSPPAPGIKIVFVVVGKAKQSSSSGIMPASSDTPLFPSTTAVTTVYP